MQALIFRVKARWKAAAHIGQNFRILSKNSETLLPFKSVKIRFESMNLFPKCIVVSITYLKLKIHFCTVVRNILFTIHNEKKRHNSFWTVFESFAHSVAAAFWSAQHPHQQVVQHEHAGCYTVGKFATLCLEKGCENHIMDK